LALVYGVAVSSVDCVVQWLRVMMRMMQRQFFPICQMMTTKSRTANDNER